MLGKLIGGRYRVIEPIAEGGFSKTWLAEDLHLMNKFCVVKQFVQPYSDSLPLGQNARKLFHTEGERLLKLEMHPQIPNILAYIESEDCLVMEYIEGKTLLDELEQNKIFDELQITELLIELSHVLSFIHSSEIVHRDIKPNNIMRREKDQKLVLIDFGISKQLEEYKLGKDAPKLPSITGLPGYSAPEGGKASFAGDFYSLGATCIHLLTGISPNEMYQNGEGWLRFYIEKVGDIVSESMYKVLLKLLEVDPKNRYQSAYQVLFGLRSLSHPDDDLSSEVGIDYHKLRDMLADGNWKEANLETHIRLDEIMTKIYEDKDTWFDQEAVPIIPCKDLCTIEKLWLKYSKGRFGLSVQNRIFKELVDDYDKHRIRGGSKEFQNFAQQIGWRASGKWLNFSQFTYSIEAPEGHLPSAFCFYGIGENLSKKLDCDGYPHPYGDLFYHLLILFFIRLKECGLD